MAEETSIDIALKIDPNSIKSIGEAKKALKDLKSAVLEAGEGSEAFDKLNAKAGALQDRLNNVNEQVKSLAVGSKLEGLSNQFGLVGDKIKSLDFAGAAEQAKKLAIASKAITFGEATKGLKELGSTFLSVGKSLLFNPLFGIPAVIIGLSVALYKLKDDIAIIGNAFDAVTDIFDGAVKSLKKFTDSIGLTNFAGKKAAEDTIVISGKVTKAVVERYEREIALAQAAGEKTEQLEYAKSLAVIEATKGEIKANQAAYEAGVITLEEKQKKQEEFNELLKKTELEKAVTLVKIGKETRDAIDKREEESKQKQIKADEEKKKRDEQAADLKNRLLAEQDAEVAKANEEGAKEQAKRFQRDKTIFEISKQFEISELEVIKEFDRLKVENAYATEEEIFKLVSDNQQRKYDAAKATFEISKEFGLSEIEIQKEFDRIRLENKFATDAEIFKSIEDNEKKKLDLAQKAIENDKKLNEEKLRTTKEYASYSLQVAAGLSNLIYSIEENNTKKSDKVTLASQKKAFNRKKTLGIVNSVISTAEAIISAAPDPTRMAFAGIVGAASIATIASQKFQPPGESGSSGGGATPTVPSVTQSFGGGGGGNVPSFSPSANLINPNPNFTGTAGAFSGNNQPPVRAYVVESEMTDAQLRAERFRQRATLR